MVLSIRPSVADVNASPAVLSLPGLDAQRGGCVRQVDGARLAPLHKLALNVYSVRQKRPLGLDRESLKCQNPAGRLRVQRLGLQARSLRTRRPSGTTDSEGSDNPHCSTAYELPLAS